MTSVCIVRPFGTKSITIMGKDGRETAVAVNFDQIDTLLIQTALAQNGLQGNTAGMIAEVGNIRPGLFQMLVTYDLVVADISIDNANVFYQLGIRHGLRPNGTILIRFPTTGTNVPFDLKTDRYIEYSWEDPAAAADLLTMSIRDTISAIRSSVRRPDSPVYLLIPELRAPDAASLVVIPREFQEAVEQAENDDRNGSTMLALLGEEAKRNSWARQGVRLVGRAQRRMYSFKAAQRSWEFIRTDLPDDIEANLNLATIFQRLGDLVSASQACRRVLDNPFAERKDRADARSQLARNEKAAWVADFIRIGSVQARRQRAITDSRLMVAFEGYMAGFAEDLNDYYSGINALGLLTAIVVLAEMEPDAWAGRFATEDEAAITLKQLQVRLVDLRGAVRMSLENARQQSERAGRPDEWLPPSEAQYRLLTADRPAFVKNAYNAAKNAGGNRFSVTSEARQVAIFGSLGILPKNCRAAFEALGMQGAAPVDVLAKALSVSFEELSVSFEADAIDRVHAVGGLVWKSSQLDACLLRLAMPVDGVAPLPLARDLPHVSSSPHPRVHVIGYSDGRELSLFLQDNELLDHEGPPTGKPSDPAVVRVQYRAATQAGSAGSPVFNASSLQVVAQHQSGGSMRRLNEQSGTWQASEGIWIQSIVQAVRRDLGDRVNMKRSNIETKV